MYVPSFTKRMSSCSISFLLGAFFFGVNLPERESDLPFYLMQRLWMHRALLPSTHLSSVRGNKFIFSIILYRVNVQCSRISCYAASHNLLKVSCAGLLSTALFENTALLQCMLCINRLETVFGLTVHSLCKNIVMEYSNVQKWICGIRHRMKGKINKDGDDVCWPVYTRRSPVRTPAVVLNNDWCFLERVHNGCAGLHYIKIRRHWTFTLYRQFCCWHKCIVPNIIKCSFVADFYHKTLLLKVVPNISRSD
jgi:hypothetical protein